MASSGGNTNLQTNSVENIIAKSISNVIQTTTTNINIDQSITFDCDNYYDALVKSLNLYNECVIALSQYKELSTDDVIRRCEGEDTARKILISRSCELNDSTFTQDFLYSEESLKSTEINQKLETELTNNLQNAVKKTDALFDFSDTNSSINSAIDILVSAFSNTEQISNILAKETQIFNFSGPVRHCTFDQGFNAIMRHINDSTTIQSAASTINNAIKNDLQITGLPVGSIVAIIVGSLVLLLIILILIRLIIRSLS